MICFRRRFEFKINCRLKSYGELYIKSFLGELGFVVKVPMNWCKMMI